MSSASNAFPPFVRRALIFIGLAVLAVLLAALLWYTFHVFLVIFAGVLVGIFLYSLSQTLARWLPLSYPYCLALVVIVLVCGFGAFFYFLVPNLAERMLRLSSQLEDAVNHLLEQVRQWPWGRQFLDQLPEQGELFSGKLSLLSIAGNVLGTVFEAAVGVVVILFLGFYTAATPGVYRYGILVLVPPDHRPRAADVLGDLRITLWRWILGRLFSMAVIGVANAIGLWLMGIPLPIAIGVISGLLTFLPNIGPILATIPPALLALEQSPMMVIYVVLFHIVLQGVESYLLTPLVQRHEVSLPPALTISAQVLMGVWAGILGLAMATPLAAALMVLIEDLYVRDVLRDYQGSRLPHEK